MRITQFYHTVRHLRAQQIIGQLSRRAFPKRHHPARTASLPKGPFPGLNLELPQNLLSPEPGNHSKATLLNGCFDFLNHSRDLGFPPQWDEAQTEPKLWCYNLHYFDWIHQLDDADAATAIRHWIDHFPAKQGGLPWEPYPTSLRCLNWILYLWGTHRVSRNREEPFIELAWGSLAQQLNYLAHNLETHLLGNHLLENLATLSIAGSCFSGDTAVKWRQTGLQGLAVELNEQFPSDGLHFEASPMYHLRSLYLLYLLNATNDPELQTLVRPFLTQGVEALEKVCHPDGEIALFNDSAHGIYHSAPVLLTAIRRTLDQKSIHDAPSHELTQTAKKSPCLSTWKLKDSGYYGVRDHDGNYLICDAGRIGPDYLPGHAHGDMLSYELSYRGHRVIVDTGNYDYETGETRNTCRSTRAHNTVEINGRDQCDFWGAFRVGRRGTATASRIESNESEFVLTASHTGYQRAPSRATHQREFRISGAFTLDVTDHIKSHRPVTAISSIHLAPECEVVAQEPLAVTIRYPMGTFDIVFSGEGTLTIGSSDYFPQFGKRLSRTCLRFEIHGTDPIFAYQIRQRS